MNGMKHRVISLSLFFFRKDFTRLCGYNSVYPDYIVNPAQGNCSSVDYHPLASLKLRWYKVIVEREMSLDFEL